MCPIRSIVVHEKASHVVRLDNIGASVCAIAIWSFHRNVTTDAILLVNTALCRPQAFTNPAPPTSDYSLIQTDLMSYHHVVSGYSLQNTMYFISDYYISQIGITYPYQMIIVISNNLKYLMSDDQLHRTSL